MTDFSGRLAQIQDELSPKEWGLVRSHLEAGTSANWLASVLTKHGHEISATTIKDQRRKVFGND